jgi:hypothetical protein
MIQSHPSTFTPKMHAATLRSRHAKLATSQAREQARQQQQPLTPSDAANDNPSSPRPARPSAPINSARIRLVGLALVILVVFVLRQSAEKRKAAEPFEVEPGWTVGRLPSFYAVCSPRERGEAAIWTVRETGNEREECMVVKGKEVAWTGRLEEMRAIFGDKETVGPGRSPRELEAMGVEMDVRKNGIRIYWVPQGGSITVSSFFLSLLSPCPSCSFLRLTIHRLSMLSARTHRCSWSHQPLRSLAVCCRPQGSFVCPRQVLLRPARSLLLTLAMITSFP